MKSEIIPTNQNKYPKYCCQKCGEQIGYIGRFLQWIKLDIHERDCKRRLLKLNSYHQ